MADRYDVIFLGISAEESERDLAIRRISAALEMAEADLRQLLEKGNSLPVKEGVSLEMAKKYQTVLQRLGGVSNFRPSLASGPKLELAPLEDPSEKLVFACPACDFRQEFPDEKEMPLQCPKCGVIPSKYDKVAAIKEEREKIRQRLLNAQKLREQQGLEQAEREEREARQRQLEEEIRKELGLPKLINSRIRLFGSVAFIWVLGIGMGAGGAALFYKFAEPTAGNLNMAGKLDLLGEDAMSSAENELGMPPQQDTLRQVLALNRSKNSNAAQANEAAATDTAAVAPEKDPKAAHLDALSIWQEINQDGEWDLYVLARAEKSIAAGQTAKAYPLANAINSSSLKIKAFGQLAEYFRKANNIAEGENLFNVMANYINSLPEAKERIEAYGILAVSLERMGDQQKAQQHLDAAEKIASALTDPVDSAKTLARVANYQAQAGKKTEADANFRRVNTLIHSFNDKATLLATYITLATSYAESGNKGIASAILSEAQSATKEQIQAAEAQNHLFGEIAEAYAKIGDVDSVLAVSGNLPADMRDKALYTLTSELAYAGRLYDAMKILDKLDPPEYKARAAALISRFQSAHPEMSSLSAATQEKAIAAYKQISNPQDQSIVQAEFARYQAHAGQAQTAEEWGQKALSNALTIESAQARDTIMAVLSINLARANQAKLADETKKLIVAPSLAEQVGKDTTATIRLFGEL